MCEGRWVGSDQNKGLVNNAREAAAEAAANDGI
jgi:hypothetical protein